MIVQVMGETGVISVDLSESECPAVPIVLSVPDTYLVENNEIQRQGFTIYRVGSEVLSSDGEALVDSLAYALSREFSMAWSTTNKNNQKEEKKARIWGENVRICTDSACERSPYYPNDLRMLDPFDVHEGKNEGLEPACSCCGSETVHFWSPMRTKEYIMGGLKKGNLYFALDQNGSLSGWALFQYGDLDEKFNNKSEIRQFIETEGGELLPVILRHFISDGKQVEKYLYLDTVGVSYNVRTGEDTVKDSLIYGVFPQILQSEVMRNLDAVLLTRTSEQAWHILKLAIRLLEAKLLEATSADASISSSPSRIVGAPGRPFYATNLSEVHFELVDTDLERPIELQLELNK